MCSDSIVRDWHGKPYYSLDSYCKNMFHHKCYKIALNARMSCPNRDGTLSYGGCTFCSNEAFTPSYCRPGKSVRQQLQEGIEFHRNRYRQADRYLAYFQSFSNTYAPLDRLKTVFAAPVPIALTGGSWIISLSWRSGTM